MIKKEIKITTEYITLGQLLKICDLVNSGGEVKIFLSSHEIRVNGENDNRRGKKLYPNDVVTIEKEEFYICK